MTKSTPTAQQQQPAQAIPSAGGPSDKAIQKIEHPAHPATPKQKQKRPKVFFNTVDNLLKKKADYEAKLAQMQGTQFKRKRQNTLKVIMQINRAIKNQEVYIKDPEEFAQKKHNDRIKRISKKLEKKRMRQIVQNVREEEKYGISHTAIQSRK